MDLTPRLHLQNSEGLAALAVFVRNDKLCEAGRIARVAIHTRGASHITGKQRRLQGQGLAVPGIGH